MKSMFRIKKVWQLLFFGCFLFAFKKVVWAYDLTLTSVGNQSMLGTNYSLVNYQGSLPMLVGTASPSAQVGVKIKTVLSYTSASTSGVWNFVPTSLDQGDNTVVISSGSQSLSFTLRFNATASAVPTATPSAMPDESGELPDSGVWEYYLPVIAVGLGAVWAGRYGKRWMQKWEKGD